MCGCKGDCRDNLGKLTFPKGNSTYASNMCETDQITVKKNEQHIYLRNMNTTNSIY